MQQPPPQHRSAEMPAAPAAQGQASHTQPRTAMQQPQVRTAVPAAPNAAPSNEDHEGSDWGLAPSKPGISRENKFILFVLLVLVAVFSFVVFRNFQKKQNAAKAGEVAGKDGKSKAPNVAADAKSIGTDTPPLQEPQEAEADALASGETQELSDDPFSTAAASDEAPETASRNSRGEQQPGAEVPAQEGEAPLQLDASVDEAPAQATDLFEPPKQESEPAAAEFVDAAPSARRGRRQVRSEPEPVESAPAQLSDPTQGEPMADQPMEVPMMEGQLPQDVAELDPMQQPMEVADFNTEPAAPSDLAQTAGTAAEPIAKKGTTPRTPGFETAQAPAQADPFGGQPDSLTPTTTPRTTTPRTTSPRTAVQPTPAPPPAPPATQPRVGSVPPPLDPNDPRLGGYREGALNPAGAAHRTASRPIDSMASGHFDPHSEPLVANVGEYIVRPNDNYWRISRKVYGTARYFQALAKHNEATIPDPRHMKPGIKISTPAKEQLEQQYGNLLPVMAAPRPVGAVMNTPSAPKTPGYYVEADGQPAYRIGPTDTLSTISRKTLGRASRWDEIYELNKDRLSGADALAVGSILRLPPDASQTRVVGRPVEHR